METAQHSETNIIFEIRLSSNPASVTLNYLTSSLEKKKWDELKSAVVRINGMIYISA